jgi:hypothetical protein
MRRFSRMSGAILGLLLLFASASSLFAELSVVIGYDTRVSGEIEECG